MKIQNLSLRIKNNQILDNIELALNDNTIYGLVGQNGAGKSTFFKSILNLTNHSGSITIDEKSIPSQQIGKLIEYPYFYEELSVGENLLVHSNYLNKGSSNIDEMLSVVGLLEKKDEKVKKLSLGMKQRLGIARALLGDNVLYLLDEPQNGLDPIWIKKIRGVFREHLKKNMQYAIISSHNLNELHQIADEFIFMNNGKIICNLKNKESNEYYIIHSNIKLSPQHGLNHIDEDVYVSDWEPNFLKEFTDINKNCKITTITLEELYEQIIILSSGNRGYSE